MGNKLNSLKAPKAIGYTSKGDRKEFEVSSNWRLICYGFDLVSLTIPYGVKNLDCGNNLLTELNIPESVIKIICDRNVLGLDKVYWDCNIKLF